MAAFILAVVWILAAVFGPIFTIAAVNTISSQEVIPFNFNTWLAMFWIGVIVRGCFAYAKSSK